MLKSITKWLLKKVLTKDMVKMAIKTANMKLAENKLYGDKKKVAEWIADASKTLSLYSEAFKNDGAIDLNELENIMDHDFSLVDKYLPDQEAMSDFIDGIFEKRWM